MYIIRQIAQPEEREAEIRGRVCCAQVVSGRYLEMVCQMPHDLVIRKALSLRVKRPVLSPFLTHYALAALWRYSSETTCLDERKY